MDYIEILVDGRVVISTKTVAKLLDLKHKKILKEVQAIIQDHESDDQFFKENIFTGVYFRNNKEKEMYGLTRDSFLYLVNRLDLEVMTLQQSTNMHLVLTEFRTIHDLPDEYILWRAAQIKKALKEEEMEESEYTKYKSE